MASPPRNTSSGTRHAAALAWAQAAAPALNSTPPEMLEAFNAPPPSDPLVDSVRALLGPTPKWSGTATQLLKLLPLCQTPRALSAQLNKSILPLADAGIDIQFRRLPGGERVIDLFASQNLQPPPQPEPEMELIPTPQIPAPPALCVTTPVGQLGKLRAGCLPAQPAEPVPSAAASKSSDTIETTPLIDTVPDILARIVARKREELAAAAPTPLEAWEREAALRLPARRDFRAALAAHAPRHHRRNQESVAQQGRPLRRFRPAPASPRDYATGRRRRPLRPHRPGLLPGQPGGSRRRPRGRLPTRPAQGFHPRSRPDLEAAAHGADAILLIAAILTERQIRDFRELAARHRLALWSKSTTAANSTPPSPPAPTSSASTTATSPPSRSRSIPRSSRRHACPPAPLRVSESGIHSAGRYRPPARRRLSRLPGRRASHEIRRPRRRPARAGGPA